MSETRCGLKRTFSTRLIVVCYVPVVDGRDVEYRVRKRTVMTGNNRPIGDDHECLLYGGQYNK